MGPPIFVPTQSTTGGLARLDEKAQVSGVGAPTLASEEKIKRLEEALEQGASEITKATCCNAFSH